MRTENTRRVVSCRVVSVCLSPRCVRPPARARTTSGTRPGRDGTGHGRVYAYTRTRVHAYTRARASRPWRRRDTRHAMCDTRHYLWIYSLKHTRRRAASHARHANAHANAMRCDAMRCDPLQSTAIHFNPLPCVCAQCVQCVCAQCVQCVCVLMCAQCVCTVCVCVC
jgi:hypothetical protein